MKPAAHVIGRYQGRGRVYRRRQRDSCRCCREQIGCRRPSATATHTLIMAFLAFGGKSAPDAARVQGGFGRRFPAQDHLILRFTPTGWNLRQAQRLLRERKRITT